MESEPTSPARRYCPTCCTDVDGLRCSCCLGATLAPDDPEIEARLLAMPDTDAERRTEGDLLVASFAGGVPGALLGILVIAPWIFGNVTMDLEIAFYAIAIPAGIGVLLAWGLIVGLRGLRRRATGRP